MVSMRAIDPSQGLVTWTTVSEQVSFGSIRVNNLCSETYCSLDAKYQACSGWVRLSLPTYGSYHLNCYGITLLYPLQTEYYERDRIIHLKKHL